MTKLTKNCQHRSYQQDILLKILMLIATIIVSVSPVSGHHSYTGIDRDSLIAFRGRVTQFNWRNPHVYIIIETMDYSDKPVEWEIETGGTPILARSGWTSESLKPGDVVNFRGHPERAKDRSYALLSSIEKEDGTILSQSARASQSDESSSDLAGVWKSRAVAGAPIEPLSSLYESFIAQEQTSQGKKAVAQYDPRLDNQTALCIGYSVLTTMASPHYLNEIQINDDTVVIRNEWFDAERIVYMDGRGHPENGERSLNGHSIGHWEGEALIIDTRLFSEHRSPYGTGLPSSINKHLLERYELNPDGKSLIINVFLEDPNYLASPFTGTLNWNYTPDLELYRYDCDPSVAGKFGPE